MEEYDIYIMSRAVDRILGALLPLFIVLCIAAIIIVIVCLQYRKKMVIIQSQNDLVKRFESLAKRVEKLEQNRDDKI